MRHWFERRVELVRLWLAGTFYGWACRLSGHRWRAPWDPEPACPNCLNLASELDQLTRRCQELERQSVYSNYLETVVF